MDKLITACAVVGACLNITFGLVLVNALVRRIGIGNFLYSLMTLTVILGLVCIVAAWFCAIGAVSKGRDE
jgi:hypothetical protein